MSIRGEGGQTVRQTDRQTCLLKYLLFTGEQSSSSNNNIAGAIQIICVSWPVKNCGILLEQNSFCFFLVHCLHNLAHGNQRIRIWE